MHFLAALQFRKAEITSRVNPNLLYPFLQPENDAELPQVVAQCLNDFPMYELKNRWPLIVLRSRDHELSVKLQANEVLLLCMFSPK